MLRQHRADFAVNAADAVDIRRESADGRVRKARSSSPPAPAKAAPSLILHAIVDVCDNDRVFYRSSSTQPAERSLMVAASSARAAAAWLRRGRRSRRVVSGLPDHDICNRDHNSQLRGCGDEWTEAADDYARRDFLLHHLPLIRRARRKENPRAIAGFFVELGTNDGWDNDARTARSDQRFGGFRSSNHFFTC